MAKKQQFDTEEFARLLSSLPVLEAGTILDAAKNWAASGAYRAAFRAAREADVLARSGVSSPDLAKVAEEVATSAFDFTRLLSPGAGGQKVAKSLHSSVKAAGGLAAVRRQLSRIPLALRAIGIVAGDRGEGIGIAISPSPERLLESLGLQCPEDSEDRDDLLARILRQRIKDAPEVVDVEPFSGLYNGLGRITLSLALEGKSEALPVYFTSEE